MTLIEYLLLYKYLAVFVAAILEGPVVMTAVGFLIKLGYLQPVFAYACLVLGDLVGDIGWYYLGYFGLFSIFSDFGEFIGFKKHISNKVAKLFRSHETKILFLSKLTLGLGFSLVVLVTAGILKVPIKKFATINFLGSIRDGKYYIGSTTDIKRRLKQHQQNQTPTTRRFGGVKLVFSQEYSTIKEARIIERKLKNLKRKDYLKKIIEEGFIKIKP
jgi:putative endonuclease